MQGEQITPASNPTNKFRRLPSSIEKPAVGDEGLFNVTGAGLNSVSALNSPQRSDHGFRLSQNRSPTMAWVQAQIALKR